MLLGNITVMAIKLFPIFQIITDTIVRVGIFCFKALSRQRPYLSCANKQIPNYPK